MCCCGESKTRFHAPRSDSQGDSRIKQAWLWGLSLLSQLFHQLWPLLQARSSHRTTMMPPNVYTHVSGGRVPKFRCWGGGAVPNLGPVAFVLTGHVHFAERGPCLTRCPVQPVQGKVVGLNQKSHGDRIKPARRSALR